MVNGGLITTNGKKIVLDRTFNNSPTRGDPNQFKVGVSTTTASTSDTDLGHPVPISGVETVDACDDYTNWTDSADCTTSDNTTTFKEGTGSVNLTKDGTSSAYCIVQQTTASGVNFTSKELSVWLYIKDATALAYLSSTFAFAVRFGSDSSNYYEWHYDSADLSVGWNLIDGLTSASADATIGSPVLTSCDYIYFYLKSDASGTTWSAGDFMIDDIKVVSSGDYFKVFESGYPSVDYTALSCTIRGRINVLEANGYNLTEFGLFNDDGTPLIFSRDVFTAVSKSSTDEVIFEVVTKIV